MVALTLLTFGKVVYETKRLKDKLQFVFVYTILVVTIVAWLPTLLNQTLNKEAKMPGLFAFQQSNPFGVLEIWIFCWTYYCGITESTSKKQIDSITLLKRYAINTCAILVTLAFSISFEYFNRKWIGSRFSRYQKQ